MLRENWKQFTQGGNISNLIAKIRKNLVYVYRKHILQKIEISIHRQQWRSEEEIYDKQ